MSDLDEIKYLINKVEKKYSVVKWKHNDYYLWPVLRIYLYMYLVKLESNNNVFKKKNISRVKQLTQLVKTFKDLSLLDGQIKTIYIGEPSHCVNYQGVKYNRYFDPLMDSEESLSLYFSKSNSKKRVYKPERHFLFSPLRIWFSMVDKLFGCYSPPTPYIQELCEILKLNDIQIDGFKKTLKEKVRTVDISFAMFRFLFKKLKPEKVWVLCYYSADILGGLIAAHKLSIQTIDMQHGGQGDNHLAYSNWSNVPEPGYEALPNYFYTWDDSSAKTINTWAKKNQKHSSKVFGNPWVDGWKQNKFQQCDYVWPKNIVLYTLQPTGEPLENYILETIQKTKNKWNWWLRLHPRQMNEKDEISLRLKEYGVFDSVNIEEATHLLLPEILIHTKVHITKFSGCALEAYQFNVPSIIIDSRGVEIYKKYIDDKDKVRSDLSNDTKSLQDSIESVY